MDSKQVSSWLKKVKQALDYKEPGMGLNKMPNLKKDVDNGDVETISRKLNRLYSEGVFDHESDVPNYSDILRGPAHGRKGEIVMMHPMTYTHKTIEGFNKRRGHDLNLDEYLQGFSSEDTAKYADMMYNGEMFSIPHLDYSRDTFQQEGRHMPQTF